MDKTTLLIEEIQDEITGVRKLAEKIQNKYRVIGALLLSAKSLIPKDRWESWLHANLGINTPLADMVIAGEFSKSEMNFLMVPSGIHNYQSNVLEQKTDSIPSSNTIGIKRKITGRK